MKFWNRLVVGLMTLALGLSLGLGDAMAASSQSKKKDSKKKEAKKKETRRSAPSGPKTYLSGTNVNGRSGLIYADTAQVAGLGQVEGSAHFTLQTFTGGNFINIPFGGHFGIARNFEISASGTPVITTIDGFGSGSAFLLTFGGKYKFDLKTDAPVDLALGADVTIPVDGGSAIVTPRGVVSYTLASGVLLNGMLGVNISGGSTVSASAGAGVPFSPNFTGLIEIGANPSVLAGGIRIGQDAFKFQALLGVPLNGASGVILGGGIILASK